jgi:hypothetical protein
MSKETIDTVGTTAAHGGGSASMIWAGRILSGLASAFFVMDAVMKLIQPQFVIDSTRGIGWPVDPVTLSILGCLLRYRLRFISFAAPPCSGRSS